MKLSATFSAAEKVSTDVIIISLFENTKKIPSELNAINKASEGAISGLLKNGDFTGTLMKRQ